MQCINTLNRALIHSEKCVTKPNGNIISFASQLKNGIKI